MLPNLQSAYLAHCFTDTAVLKISPDILMELGSGILDILMIMNLLSAFNSVDYSILLQRLPKSHGINGEVSDLDDCSQCVSSFYSSPTTSKLLQGLVLGSILFVLYIADLLSVHSCQVLTHLPATLEVTGSRPTFGGIAEICFLNRYGL